MKDKIVTLVYSIGVGGGLGMVIGSWGFLGREFYDYCRMSALRLKSLKK